MKKLILSLTIVSLLIFPLGAAALTDSQQEPSPLSPPKRSTAMCPPRPMRLRP